MFCHHSQINDAAVTQDGRYLATVGADNRFKVWDIRMMKNLFDYFVGVSGGGRKLSCSQKGLLALAGKDRVEIWKDWYLSKQKASFMKYDTVDRRIITDIQFAPYEDYLGIGTERGFQTCMVPGSGEANFDTFEEGINLSRK
jgi:U3 small nucleolar RNA-associated protein 7